MPKFIFERTKTGFCAHHEIGENDGIVVTTGKSLDELKKNAVEAYNLHFKATGATAITADRIELEEVVPFCTASDKPKSAPCRQRLDCQCYSNFFIAAKDGDFKNEDIREIYRDNFLQRTVKGVDGCANFEPKSSL